MVLLVSIAVFLLAITVLHILTKLWLNRSVLPLPPGPRGLPILGNVSDMPKPGVLECHHWFEHRKKYGPISSVTIMGQTIVIINDATIALDLLRSRSAIYSSRPSLTFSGEMVGWRHVTAMMPYSDTWKIHRRNIKKITSTATSLAEFDRIQETETAHFLVNLFEAPERLLDHIRHETGCVILKIVYGYDTRRDKRDPLVDMAETTVAQFAEASVPGTWAVDTFPFLKYLPDWVPGTDFKKTAQAMSDQLIQCVNQPYAFVKQRMHEERQTLSFLSQSIATIGTDANAEFVHKWTALALYLGGADTTVSALSIFFLAMSLFPSIQVAAQSELDAVLGVPPRLPTAEDLPHFPYIEAVVKETFRWHQVAPMGLPHTNISSDTYSDYHIPQGSIILANIWAFMHDPSTYRDPFIFRPERFLGPEAELDPRGHVFGYGRRICPGKYMAERALKITIASTLAVFSIEKEGEMETTFCPGLLSHPSPFKCSIRARSGVHEEVVRGGDGSGDAEELEGVRW
ncbi:uncharacterized protein SETTUDRAFT_155669 [Exserohilum turcica Et28A]|uniref:Cytochrome P450 n=1 Tax=Exserohilum turcicum (strain 28A) TaxID=671987 RepID=R0ID22_EXST2|nr:uncharacterized protein SETTUDRAFT_155669 [Exserohilum turcica Et28A]EOA83066.1 hypothetical protein SETTUDRAFT_155669 [Exserohilum turcica Et28A]